MKKIISILLMSILTMGLMCGAVSAEGRVFLHPGTIHKESDFQRMRSLIEEAQTRGDYASNEAKICLSGWNTLLANSYSNPDWTPRATATVIRGGQGDNVAQMYIDIARAYQCAMVWRVLGDDDERGKACGKTAAKILNAWSGTMKTLGGNADRYLAAGIFGYEWANTSEIMRSHPDFDVKAMQKMLLEVFYYPLNERFLTGDYEFTGPEAPGRDHNDACITNYWANWDLCNMAATVAIGIFCDREDIFNKGINYFKFGYGNGSIYNAVPFIHPDGTGQWQESGRDQGHANLGVGLAAGICEMAWSQGIDLYGWADNRLMRGAEYTAVYNNGDDVKYTTYEWGTGQKNITSEQTNLGGGGRGENRPIWEMIYNHYVKRRGISESDIPGITKRASLMRPEGGAYGGAHATAYDQPGFGTLSFTQDINPEQITAELPNGNIPEGTFVIKSAADENMVLTASGSADEAPVLLMGRAEDDKMQQWTIKGINPEGRGGQYTIVNVGTGKALTIMDGLHAHGATAILKSYFAAMHQRYAFMPVDNNYLHDDYLPEYVFTIMAVHSHNVVGIHNNNPVDGAEIEQWRYLQNTSQKWKLEMLN